MKKFFKVLALVLALALVIGVVPATSASAAGVKKSKTLFVKTPVGTSEDGTVKSHLKTKVAIYKLAGYDKETKEGHTFKAELVGEDKGIIKIGEKFIKAQKLGKAEIQIYIDDVKASRTTTIKVNENAETEDLIIVDGDKKAIEAGAEFVVGGEYTFMLPRAGKDSDERRLFINDKAIADADAKNPRVYKYTFTESELGDVTIKYESFQGGKLDKATQSKTLTGKVTLGKMDNVKQTTYQKFDIIFSNAATAKAAVDATTPSLSQGTSAVTEAAKIIKVFKLGTNGEEIAAFIGALAVDETDKNVAHITMFADLEQEVTYKVVYGDSVKTFKAAKWQPAKIDNSYGYVANKDMAGGTATLATYIFAIGDQGQNVDITDKVKDLGNIEYFDAATTNDYTKYNVSGNLVDFYVNNYTAKVNVVFTYYGNGAAEEYKNLNYAVTSSDNRVFTVVNYYLDSVLTSPNPGTKKEAYISADEGDKVLDVKIKIDTLVDGKPLGSPEYVYGNDPMVKFVTANTDKLAAREDTGYFYAPKAANANIAVWVYYGEKAVDADPDTAGIQPIYVTVYDHKRLGSATASVITDGRLYGNSVVPATDKQGYQIYQLDPDAEGFDITVLDVQGRPYNEVQFEVEKVTDALDKDTTGNKVADSNPIEVFWGAAGNAELLKDDTTGLIPASDVDTEDNTDNVFIFGFDESGSTPIENKSSKALTYKITISDLNSTEKRYVTVTFKVKNVDNAVVTSKVVETVPADGSYRVVGTDSESFRVCGYYLNNDAVNSLSNFAVTDKLYLGFFRNSDGKEVNFANVDAGKTVRLITVEDVPGGGLTKLSKVAKMLNDGAVTGGAIYRRVVDDGTGALEVGKAYIKSGSYSARAYTYKSAKRSVVNSKAFNYDPTLYYTLTWKWNSAYVETVDAQEAINEAIVFTYTYSKAGHTYKYVGTVDEFLAGGIDDSNGGAASDPINIAISYTEKDLNSVSVLYAYVDAYDAADLAAKAGSCGVGASGELYVETPILRTIYLGQSKYLIILYKSVP